jgi:spore coat protein CotH
MVDGKSLGTIGVGFRGNTSYSTVSEGYKRSLKISINYVDADKRLYGYRSLNLLNSAADPTFLRSVLYMYVARQYFPAPKANFVRVAINGESWGVYANVEQFNSDETEELFGSSKGARWKVPGSPRSSGGLGYFGEVATEYKRVYEIKTKDKPQSWAELIHFSRVLSETPPDKLEKAMEPLLDIDSTLRWLALDKASINNDGYWTRSSDYDIYEDPDGRFHVIPWDANETFRETEAFGFGGGGGGKVDLDPFAGADDPEKALLNKLLAVPALRTRYLRYLRDIAENWLSWNKIGRSRRNCRH